ncbi:MAG: 16S rRNA pseudouridine(516) synthase [Clostridia bacterium]|nr:16S rRNA pseudouridine(516) synthase [Clostridia bacterium]
MEDFRLDKLVAELFRLTRKQAKKEIACGNVSVNGAVQKQSAMHCFAEDIICLNGQRGVYQKFYYIMMNKPKGVLSATKDRNTKTALDLLPEDMKRNDLFVAGRLDKNTTGFLLLTNDGEFAHNILSPKNHIPKTYVATLERDISPQDVDAFANGISLKEGICKPAKLVDLSNRRAEITIVEGKFHQIKRMFHAVNNEVHELHRDKMGGLALDSGLQPGEARYITEDEMVILKGELYDGRN